MGLLVREDAAKNAATQRASAAEMNFPEEGNIVVLELLTVTGEKRTPEFTAPRETRVAKVLRTGTIMQRAGKKTTMRLWASGDAGIVFTINW